MDILRKIIADKAKEVEMKKGVVPISVLEKSILFERKTFSLKNSISKNPNGGIIAEFKRKSPSKQQINNWSNVGTVAMGYTDAGVSGMSVLTDIKYFGGSLEDLLLARASTFIPILRKEFIIDEYQVYEAKAHGADAILLISAVLDAERLKSLSQKAHELGLEVLAEIHNQEELAPTLLPTVDLIGVNNRNLKNFKVDLDTSRQLSKKIPNEFVKVSESGISQVADIKNLMGHGYQGFLLGETFMKQENPGKSAKDFIQTLSS